ncbi:MAG: hypothetical protein WCA21_15860 [Terracidiphilus sp.]|jgi:hypothetical protein
MAKKTNEIAAFIRHMDDKILIWIPGPKYRSSVRNLTARLDEEGTLRGARGFVNQFGQGRHKRGA